jgi:hypothetical protein
MVAALTEAAREIETSVRVGLPFRVELPRDSIESAC